MQHRDLLLQALKYPKPSKTLLDNDVEFATLILWLENTKVRRHFPLALQSVLCMPGPILVAVADGMQIRQYRIDDRKDLSDFQSSEWERSFHKVRLADGA